MFTLQVTSLTTGKGIKLLETHAVTQPFGSTGSMPHPDLGFPASPLRRNPQTSKHRKPLDPDLVEPNTLVQSLQRIPLTEESLGGASLPSEKWTQARGETMTRGWLTAEI